MTDINNIMLGIPINIKYSLIFIIFLIALYFIYKTLNKKNEIKTKIKTNFGNVESLYIYLEKLNILEKNIEEINFYKELISILRDILEYKGVKNISKMTLEEINKLKIKSEIKVLIKSIYFKEYAKKFEDSEKIRKELILSLRKLIK